MSYFFPLKRSRPNPENEESSSSEEDEKNEEEDEDWDDWDDASKKRIDSVSKALDEAKICRDVLINDLHVPFDVGTKFYEIAAERASIIHEQFTSHARWSLYKKMGKEDYYEDVYKDVAFSPDGSHIAVLNDSKSKIVLWDFNKEEVKHVNFPLKGTGMRGSRALAYSSNESRIVTRSNQDDKNLISWRFHGTGWFRKTIETGHDEKVLSVAFSPAPNTTRIASGSLDGKVKVWDMPKKEFVDFSLIKTFKYDEPQKGVKSVAFSRDGTLVAATGDDRVVVWNVEKDEESITYSAAGVSFEAVAFGSEAFGSEFGEGHHILVTLSNETKAIAGFRAKSPGIYVWDLKKKDDHNILYNTTAHPKCLAFRQDGKSLAVGLENGYVTIYNTPGEYHTWRVLSTIRVGSPDNRLTMRSISFSPNGFHIVTVGNNVSLRKFDENFRNRARDSGIYEDVTLWIDYTKYVHEKIFVFKYGLDSPNL